MRTPLATGGVVEQRAVEQQLRAHVGAGARGPVGQAVLAQEPAQLALEVEEPGVGVEGLVGGVVEGDAVAERAVAAPSRVRPIAAKSGNAVPTRNSGATGSSPIRSPVAI